MNKLKVAGIARSLRTAIIKHSPEIAIGLGISGMVATTVLAVKATPKAVKLLEQKAKEENVAVEDLRPIEKVKTCWKCYIPAAVTGVTAAACIIGGTSVNLKRNAALTAAYTLSDAALREYQEAVEETIGEKKEKVVREKISEKRLKEDPVSTSEVIMTKKGETLCYDMLSGRYFKSDIDRIKQAVNELNRMMTTDMCGYVSLNEFYDELDLPHTEMGDILGWRLDKGLIRIEFDSHLADDGTPCLAIYHKVAPEYGYSSFA